MTDVWGSAQLQEIPLTLWSLRHHDDLVQDLLRNSEGTLFSDHLLITPCYTLVSADCPITFNQGRLRGAHWHSLHSG